MKHPASEKIKYVSAFVITFHESDVSEAEEGAAKLAKLRALSVIAGFVAVIKARGGSGGDLEEEARDAWSHLVGPSG